MMQFISRIILIFISIRKNLFKGTSETSIIERSHGKINVTQIIFSNPIKENTFIVWDKTKECIIIDAGNLSELEDRVIDEYIEQRGLNPIWIVATHGHFDHLIGAEFLRTKYNALFAMSLKDIYLLEEALEHSQLFGVTLCKLPKSIDYDLDIACYIPFGKTILYVIPTPGHSPGHISLYEEFEGVLFVGDTLFKRGVGRTSYKGGNYAQLTESIINQILPLGNHVTIYPGHSESTTIGEEKIYNSGVVKMLNSNM